MKKYLLTTLIAFQMPIYGQPYVQNKFIDYENVIDDLKSAENVEILKNAYDYLFVLLLDSTNMELIEKTGYQYISEFRGYALGLSFSSRTVGFVTEKKNIKDIFLDNNSLRRIIDCSNPYNSPDIPISKIDYPVYIKDNTAIFDISGLTWSYTYFARLEKGILQINWLGGIIE